MIIILLVIGVFLPAKCEALPAKFPNARYLGMGYNVILGNGDDDGHDPGFTFSVLQFKWDTNRTTSDRKYWIPDNIQELQAPSCSFSSQASRELGSRSYQNALSVDVRADVNAGGFPWNARFSGSVGYIRVKAGTSEYRRVYTSARARCVQYVLSVNYLHVPIHVTSAFARSVSSLPLTRNDSLYISFINTWGTHFTNRVTMGAKMVVRSEFDETALTRMEEEQINIEAAAKFSFWKFSSNINTETSSERRQRERFESMRRSYSATYLGSHPPSNGRWETWAQTSGNAPYPVVYILAPITALFTNKFFPSMTSYELTQRRSLLSAAYEMYCEGIPGCGIPPPDQLPVLLKSSISTFTGTARVSCPPSYRRLSCGIKNMHALGASGDHDKRRYAIPYSNNSCECRDSQQAVCVPWCARVSSLSIRTVWSSYGSKRSVGVSCPSGYKVLGCHTKHYGDEKWPTNYPYDNGTGCYCYNYFGAECAATCGRGIRNHEVRQQYEKGVARVTCSAGNFVLGCGIKSKHPSNGYEKFRTFSVKTYNSCECYDNYGATCYALCGQFT